MRCYLSTPGNVAQAQALEGANVLISYAYSAPWMINFAPAWARVVWDSGAYTTLTKGKVVDLDKYAETARSLGWADAAASLDDIAGDWKLGLENWDQYPWMFPVYHDTDPPEALEAILERLQDPSRGRFRPGSPQWIGLGMKPPRKSARWLGETLPKIPARIHVHGFAMRGFTSTLVDHRGADCSADSVNWMLDARGVKLDYPWLSHPECVEIIRKRYEREFRMIAKRSESNSAQIGMFDS